ncbi:MAG: M48 family metalloprotease, partial [Thermoleophilaceae bacterium]
ARREGLGDPAMKPGPAVLPAIALAIGLVAFGMGVASNVLSRQVEGRADAYSLSLTRDPAAFVQLERRLAIRNVSDPDPPDPLHVLFGTHPTTVERIGIGEAWRDEN